MSTQDRLASATIMGGSARRAESAETVMNPRCDIPDTCSLHCARYFVTIQSRLPTANMTNMLLKSLADAKGVARP